MQNDSIYDKMSNSEKMVADFLQDLSLWWVYEHPVIVKDEGDRLRTWYPDFYLSEMGIYVEVCGANRKRDYDRRKKIYRHNKVPFIFVETFKPERYWKFYLLSRLIEMQENRIRILTEMPFIKEHRQKINEMK